MYSSRFSSGGRMLLGRQLLSAGKRGVSTLSESSSIRRYSMSGKRAPVASEASSTSTSQEPKTRGIKPAPTARTNKVPKFTMARTEFLTADLFAQHRQLIPSTSSANVNVSGQERPSYKTVGELLLCKGMSADEAGVPTARLRQVYAAPASAYMRVAADAMIPEAMRLGPLAEPLLGQDSFGGGIGGALSGAADSEFVEEFFDAVLENARQAPAPGAWSVRRVSRARGMRWMAGEMVDPVECIESGVVYRMTSVKRKRKTKMNKHKHRKLRKSTRALRKRLGK
ncbi:hypothetical protein GGI15_001502 [Coemansia interrupta]|uniref:Ribosomal protein mS38 C-terminal domain-containing protein n=1 Tax=Coemansia interrupta TaxID=1126814 RepID=A0A9W8HJI0_9FUNG|nr:hypothetical protein GGI15_001502 [Coemansia interrupta]